MTPATLQLAGIALLAATAQPEMGAAAWTFLSIAWLSVISLAVFCFRRVLGGPADRSDRDRR